MKNKKGFTLIELLAVIVILAIIALIATPIILNMINSAKKSSARSAALGYIDAIEYNNGFAELEQPGYTLVTGSNIDVSNINVKLKGKKPSSGTVTINSKGKVESADDLCFNGYAVDYDGKDAKVKGKCSSGSTPVVQSDNYITPTQPNGGPTLPSGSKTWIHENTSTGEKELCAQLSSGSACLTNGHQYNDEYAVAKKAEFESLGATCNIYNSNETWECYYDNSRIAIYDGIVSVLLEPSGGCAIESNGSAQCG